MVEEISNWVFEYREDISFHFSLGFTALMRRFSGNKSFNSSKYFFNANSIFSTSATNLNSNTSLPNGYMGNKDMQSMPISSSNATSSNLNPFGQGASDNPNNLLLVLQALQVVTSKSNVILIAIGGIVKHLTLKLMWKMRQFLTSKNYKESKVFQSLSMI